MAIAARTTKEPGRGGASLSQAAPRTGPDALESLLTDLLGAHERLLAASIEQRQAVRGADPALVQRATQLQTESLHEIAALEDCRRELVADLTASMPRRAPGSGPVTLSELARMMPEPQRTRLVELASRVRICVERAADEQRTLRAATGSLVAHMEGLMRQVARRLSHAGTYGRRGMVESVPAVVSGLDLVS